MKTTDSFELHFDKFSLKVLKDYWYAGYDSWVHIEGKNGVVGISDFLQTKLGDLVAFVPSENKSFGQDDVLCTVESIKAAIDVTIPVSGKLIEFNQALIANPELISQDPYGAGWIAKLELTDWDADQKMLLTADKYLGLMQEKVENLLKEKEEG